MTATLNKKDKKHVVIIGAGPAGLTAGYQLSKAGIKSIVLEKDNAFGGISRTVNYKSYYFDIGGHRFFTKINKVEELWNEVLGDEFLLRPRLSRIFYNNHFFSYPLRPINALSGLGIWNSLLVLSSYAQAQMFINKKEDTFEEWVSNRFGKRLFNIFFKTYTEKVWGIPCNEIGADWAAQRIKGLSLASAIKKAVAVKSSIKKENVVKTLIDEFYYPKFGPGMMWEAVANQIQDSGSQVLLDTEVDKIYWSENIIKAVQASQDGEKLEIEGSDFISSMPLRDWINRLQPTPPKAIIEAANRLRYRDFLTVALIVNKANVFPDNWIYIHDSKVKVGRLQNYKNWSPYMVPDKDKSCIGLEYFCFEGDDFWNLSDSDLMELAKREMSELGFLNEEEVEDGHVVRMPKAYPIYDSAYKSSLNTVCHFFDEFQNLQPVGRNGQHRYNNQDHSMLTAMMAAENVLGAAHNLWQVNEDQDYQEEVKLKTDEESYLDRLLHRAFARMDKLGLATAFGTVTGLLVFLITLAAVFQRPSPESGTYLYLLAQYFPGYTVSVTGAFIGMAFSFFWAFLFGWIAAYFKNFFTSIYIFRLKRKIEMIDFRNFFDQF